MERRIYEPEHEMFRGTVATFIQREVVPNYERWERTGRVDREYYYRAAEAGLIGFNLPEEYGGGGADDFRFNAILHEEFAARGVVGGGLALSLHNDVVAPYFVTLANEEQRGRWLPGMADGSLLAGIAMTEPGTGSDLQAISSRAVWDGEHFVLNGSKMFITNGVDGDLFVVVCRLRDDHGADGLSLVVVEAGMPGFERGPKLDKIGQRSIDTGELFFTDVRIPRENVLGEPHRGFTYLVANLPQERLAIAVVALAHAQQAFVWTLEYAKERKAFGQPIGSFQHNRFVLATMRTELDIAQVFVDRLLQAAAAGELTAEEAAEAKWWVTDLQCRVLDQCLQLHGGNGYMEEFPIARAWRDGRVMPIYGGTNEIMKDLIGRRMLGI